MNSGRKIKKESRVNVPVVAAYEMLAKKLAYHTCSEVTFNPTFFFYFSVCLLQKNWELNTNGERRGKGGRDWAFSPLFFPILFNSHLQFSNRQNRAK